MRVLGRNNLAKVHARVPLPSLMVPRLRLSPGIWMSTVRPGTSPLIAWHTKKEVSGLGNPPAPASAPVVDNARVLRTASTPTTILRFTISPPG